MNLRYNYRLYPNRAQASALDTMLWAYRRLYNDALAERKESWEQLQKNVSYYDQSMKLLKTQRSEDTALATFNCNAAQQVLRRLDKAFAAFFRRVKSGETPGYPRFKGRNRFNSVDFTWGNGAGLRGTRLHVQGVGEIKVVWHRAIPDEATIKQVTIKRRAGKWFASFVLELPDVEAPKHPGGEVGIDVGLKSIVTLSTGEAIAPPQNYRNTEPKLRRANRKASRRIKGSRRQRKAYRDLSILHEHIGNQRSDFLHKLSHDLTDRFAVIAVEDLNVKGLARTRLAKSIHDAGWGILFNLLDYKAARAGGTVVKVDPRYTSQDCSGCGTRVPKPLSQRTHSCPECGLVLDRDHNAALVILTRAGTQPSGANVDTVSCVS